LTTQLNSCCSDFEQTANTVEMIRLYAARIDDLGPGDFVKVNRGACSHTALLSTAFLSLLGLSPRGKVCSISRIGCDVEVRRARSRGRMGELTPLRPLTIAERKEPG
jgi:hypothetical protein